MYTLYRTAGGGASAAAGADNLLRNCVGVNTGQRVLLITERGENSLYCPRLGDLIAGHVDALGGRAARLELGSDGRASELPGPLREAMSDVDHAIFLHPLGDHSRFLPLPGGCSKTICYALDGEALASPFATVSHRLLSELLRRLEGELGRARRWRITCPLGSDISGTFCWPSLQGADDDDFTLRLFPVTTFKPVPCDTANGRVRLSRWLLPGAEEKVRPGTLRFDGVVSVAVRNGTIAGFDGPAAATRAVIEHYDFISGALGVCRERVHSWHAGVNPRVSFRGPAAGDLRRWGAVSFASPRYLHFHTCGDTPPGEIAWSLFEPTVWVDGQAYWRDGQFVWLQRADNRALIDRYGCAGQLCSASAEIGV